MQNKTATGTDPQTPQLAQHLYFPTAVYSVIRKDFLESVKPVFDEAIAIAKLKSSFDPEQPVVMSDNFFGDLRIAEFAQYIANTAWNILDGQGYEMEGKATFFTEMWGQQHSKHSAMIEHVHPFVQLVGYYFLETPPLSSKIQMHDPRPAKIMVNMPEKDFSKASIASSVITITPEPGMLFFANAWLPQSFTQQGSNEQLSFIHFNLGVRKPSFILPPVKSSAEII